MAIPQFLAYVEWKTFAEVIGAAVGLATLIKGTIEYVKQGAQKRTELFLKMRDRYDEFLDLCNLLEHRGDSEVSKQLQLIPFAKKRDFIGFYEELALMTESGLIRMAVVHYMFGYYAIACWESDDFWNAPNGLNRESKYWSLFQSFAMRMKEEEEAFLARVYNPKKYRM